MERLDPRAVKRVSGPAWQALRPQFDVINDTLLSVSTAARGELTTIYIKYLSEPECGNKPYAVLWVKKSSELVLGLALPQEINSSELRELLKGYKYAGLTRFLIIRPDDQIPQELRHWAELAFERLKKQAAMEISK